MTVTIGIKALNEERHIAQALSSALAAVAPFDGQVVLADSGSQDRTIAIARAMPARVYQLADPAQRCCGAGAQLAFQHIDTPYFYLMDGDMEIDPEFLRHAHDWLEANPEFAGVGGQVLERNLENAEFQIRAKAMDTEAHRRAGEVDRLDGGGLYRTDAIRAAGYFSDSNLKAFEEFDLAARLRANGWKFARLPLPAVYHTGHGGGGYRLMLYRLRSGQLGGAGQVLRAAVGQAHLPSVLTGLGHIKVIGAILAWWLMLIFAAMVEPIAIIPLVALPVALLAWRRRSFGLGLYSFCYWNLCAVSSVIGFFRPRRPPDRPVPSVEISPRAELPAS
ncbi:glycosyltransferase [Altererythrobacter xixiisoli]|uniref:Glycosyltransferase n=1 Tax=Croceibacterium xixiisoli TaxID=1476466 RepID=A0A6I4TWW6_9SPHN|nr:glycosyltransferase [Croceibacterium xixiisoli]MXO99128.1 glycosyltransferase [Croceibacterium xixiisoli]